MGKIIDFNRRRGEILMKNGEVLYKIDSLQPGEKVEVYSETKDLFDNDNIEKYIITKEIDGIYIEYYKKLGFEEEDKVEFKEKVKRIGTKAYNTKEIEKMKLTNSELAALNQNNLDNGLIKRGYDLIGSYENGLDFNFENIIMVSQ